MGKTRQLPGAGIQHLIIFMNTISNLLWFRVHFWNKRCVKSLLHSPENWFAHPRNLFCGRPWGGPRCWRTFYQHADSLFHISKLVKNDKFLVKNGHFICEFRIRGGRNLWNANNEGNPCARFCQTRLTWKNDLVGLGHLFDTFSRL